MMSRPNEPISETKNSIQEELSTPVLSLDEVDSYFVYPGGNDTYIAFGPSLSRSDYAIYNRVMMARHPHLEQGGFLELSSTGHAAIRLHMAGGEFCGNATRAAAALFIEDFEGQQRFESLAHYSLISGSDGIYSFPIEVSGTSRTLTVFCRRASSNGWEVETEIPLPAPEEIRIEVSLPEMNATTPLIQLDGISHLIVDTKYSPFDNTNYEVAARSFLDAAGLNSLPAAGVIWTTKGDDVYQMDPVVFVREINTCFYETSCGSGATALALDEVLKKGETSGIVTVVPPSGVPLVVTVATDDSGPKATLRGMVEVRGRL